jgi:hypothetical protein
MLKAIETRYKGYRFRSRLEARWAVFFDALGVVWEYEPEGYDLGEAGWYLPDFRLLAEREPIWIEIKPEAPTVGEARKAYELSRQGGALCFIVAGTPGEEQIWMYCSETGQKTVDVFGPEKMMFDVWDFMLNPDVNQKNSISPRTSAAYRAARSARFEHGENGNVR